MVALEKSLQICCKCYNVEDVRLEYQCKRATRQIEHCLLCRGRMCLRQMEPAVVPELPADGSTKSEVGEPKVRYQKIGTHYMT